MKKFYKKTFNLYVTIAGIGLVTTLTPKHFENSPIQTPAKVLMSTLEKKELTTSQKEIKNAFKKYEEDKLNKQNKTNLIKIVDSYKNTDFFEKALSANNTKELLNSFNINTNGMSRINTNNYLDSLIADVNSDKHLNTIIKDYFGTDTSNVAIYAKNKKGLTEKDIKYLSLAKGDALNRMKLVDEYIAHNMQFDNVYKYIDYKILRTLGYDNNEALKIQKEGFETLIIGVELERRINKVSKIVNIPKIADRYNKDPNLIGSVIGAESNFKLNAKSKSGAKGLTQLIPSTANLVGVNINDPADNVKGGTKYLRSISNKLEEFPESTRRKLASIGYNWGPANINKFLEEWKLPNETKEYVKKIETLYETFSKENKFN